MHLYVSVVFFLHDVIINNADVSNLYFKLCVSLVCVHVYTDIRADCLINLKSVAIA